MIGWYVHHHGQGHLQRMRSITAAVVEPVTVLSSLPAPVDFTGGWVQLADDLPQLASVSLSPCIAWREGMHVLGARIFTAPTDDRRDPMARVL